MPATAQVLQIPTAHNAVRIARETLRNPMRSRDQHLAARETLDRFGAHFDKPIASYQAHLNAREMERDRAPDLAVRSIVLAASLVALIGLCTTDPLGAFVTARWQAEHQTAPQFTPALDR